MSLSAIIIKIMGLVLAIVGFALLLSVVGIKILSVGLAPTWLAVVVGVCFLGAGIYIVRGGTVTI